MAPKAKRAPVAAESNKTRRKSATAIHEAKYLSASAFARFSGMSRSTVWRLRRDGHLRFVRISSHLIRIPTSEIARLGKQSVVVKEPE
jgi:predicted DNA-binding transcriptional regulator AlpA